MLYHSVPREAPDRADRFSVVYEQFATHLDAIVESGRVPVTISEIAAGLREEGRSGRPIRLASRAAAHPWLPRGAQVEAHARPGSRIVALRSPAAALFTTLPENPGQAPSPAGAVAVTFDDGYSNTLDAVGQILENNLKVTVYITTGALDQRGMSSFSQLRQLATLGDDASLGARYSVTRPHLDALPVATIAEEVVECKRYLEVLIGRTTDTFGYPHRAYDRRVRAAVIDAGFAVAVKDVISEDRDDPWGIARYTVTGDTDTTRRELVVHGWGAPLAWGRERFRTRLARTARRAREHFREAA